VFIPQLAAVAVAGIVSLTGAHHVTNTSELIRSDVAGICLTVESGHVNSDACNDAHGKITATRWRNPSAEFVSVANGECLTASNGKAVLTSCTGRPAQKWTYSSDELISKLSGRCVTMPASERGQAVMTACTTGPTFYLQRWITSKS